MAIFDFDFFIYLIIGILFVLFAAYLLKWILRIDLIIELQKEQVCLLKQLKDQEAAMYNSYFKSINDLK